MIVRTSVELCVALRVASIDHVSDVELRSIENEPAAVRDIDGSSDALTVADRLADALGVLDKLCVDDFVADDVRSALTDAEGN